MKRYGIFCDLLVVLIFDLIGRSSHKHHLTVAGVSNTYWPFATGILLGWLFLTIAHNNPLKPVSGLQIALITVVIGMLLRVISGQGTAISFIIVATLFLSTSLVAWRALLSLKTRPR